MVNRKITHWTFFVSILIILCGSASVSIAQDGASSSQSAPASIAPTTNVATPALPINDLDEFSYEPPAYGKQAVLVQTLDGRTVMEQGADQAFNPASAIKIATALAALRNLGPRHRFSTAVGPDGG